MIMRNAIVGDGRLILTTWGSLTCTQCTVHGHFRISPPWPAFDPTPSGLAARVPEADTEWLNRRIREIL